MRVLSIDYDYLYDVRELGVQLFLMLGIHENTGLLKRGSIITLFLKPTDYSTVSDRIKNNIYEKRFVVRDIIYWQIFIGVRLNYGRA